MLRRMRAIFFASTFLFAALAAVSGFGAGPPRKPWTTSRVVGSPEPPPAYRAVNVFPNVRLEHPLLVTRAHGLDRFFVAEQAGRIFSVANRPDAKAESILD